MAVNRNLFLTIIFLAVFLMMTVIGLISKISLRVSLGRALMAAVIFTAMLWLVLLLIQYYAPPAEKAESISHLGQNLDIDVADSPEADREFIPLTGRQIDPNVAKVINQNPEKAAEIIGKMGFDE